MDDRRELTAIDRALGRALDVDVSPGFVSRVRERIVRESKRAPFWRPWRIAAAAAAAMALVAGAGAVLSNRQPFEGPRLTARAVSLEPMRPANGTAIRAASHDTAIPAASHGGAALGRVTGGRRPRVVLSPPADAEVIVPRGEIEMYRRLMADARKLPPAVVLEPLPSPWARTFTDIAIDPIRIDLLEPPPGGERDRQR